MSWQIEFLKEIITSSQSGNDNAVTILRRICVAAAKSAAVYDLIALGQCLVSLGEEATKRTAETN